MTVRPNPRDDAARFLASLRAALDEQQPVTVYRERARIPLGKLLGCDPDDPRVDLHVYETLRTLQRGQYVRSTRMHGKHDGLLAHEFSVTRKGAAWYVKIAMVNDGTHVFSFHPAEH